MSDNTPTPNERQGTTGWEKADKAAHVTGKVFTGMALVMMKGYGVILVILGIILLAVAFSSAWWAGFIIIGYGVYLLFPGSKWVVW